MDLALHIAGGLLAALYAVRCGVGSRGLVEVVALVAVFGFVRESWQHAATPPWAWSAHVVNEAAAWGAGAVVVLTHQFADRWRRPVDRPSPRPAAEAGWQRSP